MDDLVKPIPHIATIGEQNADLLAEAAAKRYKPTFLSDRLKTLNMTLQQKIEASKVINSKYVDLTEGEDVELRFGDTYIDENGVIHHINDGDSPAIYSSDGSKRLAYTSRLLWGDTVDKDNALLDSKNKTYLQIPWMVALYKNKWNFNELTKAQRDNIYNWNHAQQIRALQGLDPEPFDENKTYTDDWRNVRIKARVIWHNKDFYGKRSLISVIDPKTGKDLTFEAAKNPLTNSSWDWAELRNANLKSSLTKTFDIFDDLNNRSYGNIWNSASRLWKQSVSATYQALDYLALAMRTYADPETKIDLDTIRRDADKAAGLTLGERAYIQRKQSASYKMFYNVKDKDFIDDGWKDWLAYHLDNFTNSLSNLAESMGFVTTMAGSNIAASALMTQLLKNSATSMRGKAFVISAVATLISAITGAVEEASMDKSKFAAKWGRNPTRDEFTGMILNQLPPMFIEASLLKGLPVKAMHPIAQKIFRTPAVTVTDAARKGNFFWRMTEAVGSGMFFNYYQERAQEAMSRVNAYHEDWGTAWNHPEVRFGSTQAVFPGGIMGAMGVKIGDLDSNIVQQQNFIANLLNFRENSEFIENGSGFDQVATGKFTSAFDTSKLDASKPVADNIKAVIDLADDIAAAVTQKANVNVSPAYRKFLDATQKLLDVYNEAIKNAKTDEEKAIAMANYNNLNAAIIEGFKRMGRAKQARYEGAIFSSNTIHEDAAAIQDFVNWLDGVDKSELVETVVDNDNNISAENKEEAKVQVEALLQEFQSRMEQIDSKKLNKDQALKLYYMVREDVFTDITEADRILTESPDVNARKHAIGVITRLKVNAEKKLQAYHAAIEALAKEKNLKGSSTKNATFIQPTGEKYTFTFIAKNLINTTMKIQTTIDSVFNEFMALTDVAVKHWQDLSFGTISEIEAGRKRVQALYESKQSVKHPSTGKTVQSIKSLIDTISARLNKKNRRTKTADDTNTTNTDETVTTEEEKESTADDSDKEVHQEETYDKNDLAKTFLITMEALAQVIRKSKFYNFEKQLSVIRDLIVNNLQTIAYNLQQAYPSSKLQDILKALSKDSEFLAALEKQYNELFKEDKSLAIDTFSGGKGVVGLLDHLINNYDGLFNDFALTNTEFEDMSDFVANVMESAMVNYSNTFANRMKVYIDDMERDGNTVEALLDKKNLEMKKITGDPEEVYDITNLSGVDLSEKEFKQAVRNKVLWESYYRMLEKLSDMLWYTNENILSDHQQKILRNRRNKVDKLIDKCRERASEYERLFNNGKFSEYSEESEKLIANEFGLTVGEAELMYGIRDVQNSKPTSTTNLSRTPTDVESSLIVPAHMHMLKMFANISAKLNPNQREALKRLILEAKKIHNSFSAKVSKHAKKLHNLWVKTKDYTHDERVVKHLDQVEAILNKSFSPRNVPIGKFTTYLTSNVRTVNFIYDFSKATINADNTVTVPYSREFVAYMTAAIYEFMTVGRYKYLINPLTENDAKNAYNASDSVYDISEVFEETKKNGVPLADVQNTLGSLIFDHMNLHALEEGFVGDREKLVSQMGYTALQYLLSDQVVNIDTGKAFTHPVFEQHTTSLHLPNGAVEFIDTVKVHPTYFSEHKEVFSKTVAAAKALNPIVKSNGDYVIFDIESAMKDGDSNLHNGHPIQISAVRYVDGRKSGDTLTIWIKKPDGYTIPQKLKDADNPLFKEHPLHQNDAVDIKTGIAELVKFVGKDVIVGHNIRDYDIAVLRKFEPDLFDHQLKNNKVVDTLEVARRADTKTSNSLPNLAARIGYTIQGEEHSADTDVNTTQAVLQSMIGTILNDNASYNQAPSVGMTSGFLIYNDTVFYNSDNAMFTDDLITDAHDYRLSREYLESTVRHTNNLRTISDSQIELLEKKSHIEYHCSSTAANLCKFLGKDFIMKLLGYKSQEEISNLYAKEQRESAKGENQTIEMEVEGLFTVLNTSPGSFYLPWVFLRNGRPMISNPYVNPQALKQIQRHLLSPKNATKRVLNAESRKAMSSDVSKCLAQSLDSSEFDLFEGIRINVPQITVQNDFYAWFKDSIFTPYMEGKEVVLGTNSTNTIILQKDGINGYKIDNVGQFINAVLDLIRLHNRKDGSVITIQSAFELDAKNSGGFNKTVNFAAILNDPNMGRMFGVFTTDEALHAGLNDSYKETASYIFDKARKDNPEELDKFIQTSRSKIDPTELSEFKTDTINDVTLENSAKELYRSIFIEDERFFMKRPTMTHFYNAGRKTTIARMARVMWDEQFLPEFVKLARLTKEQREDALNPESANYNPAAAYVAHMITMYDGEEAVQDILTQLKSTTSSNIRIKAIDKSLLDTFTEMVKIAIGNPTKDYLESRFNFHNDNTIMNVIGQYLFERYDYLYKKEMSRLNKEYPNGIPIKVYRERMHKLESSFPTIAPFFEDTNTPLMFARMNREGAKTSVLDGDSEIEISTEMNDIGVPGYSCCVIPIHYLDSIINQVTEAFVSHNSLFSSYGTRPYFQTIYDAQLVPVGMKLTSTGERLFDSPIEAAAYIYNTAALLVHENYCIAAEFRDAFEKAYENNTKEYNNATNTGLAVDPVIMPNRAITNAYGSKSPIDLINENGDHTKERYTVEQFRDIVKNWAENIIEKRKALFLQQGISVANQSMSNNDYFSVLAHTDYIDEHFNDIAEEGYAFSRESSPVFSSTTSSNNRLVLDSSSSEISLALNSTKEEKLDLFKQMATDDHWTREEIDEAIDLLDVLPENFDFSVKVRKEGGLVNIAEFNMDTSELTLNTKNDSARNSLSANEILYTEPYLGQTATECLFHDILHALGVYALFHTLSGQSNLLKKQLISIWEEFGNTYTWKDLLPSNYDSMDAKLQRAYDHWAQKIWNNLYDRNDINHSLAEFHAYGLSNPKMKQLLKGIKNAKESATADSLFVRLKNTFKSFLKLIMGDATMKETLKEINAILVGDRPVRKGENKYQDLLTLHKKIAVANAKAIAHIRNKDITGPMALVHRVVSGSNKFISDAIKGWSRTHRTGANDLAEGFWDDLRGRNGALRQTKAIIFSLAHMPYDIGFQQQFYTVISGYPMKQYGLFHSLIRDFTKPDMDARKLHQKIMEARSVEELAKNTEDISLRAYRELFGKDIDDEYKMAQLTNVVLRGDVQCLLSGYDYNTVRNILHDDVELDSAISKESAYLTNHLDQNRRRIVNTYLDLLVDFMSTGLFTRGTITNAKMIAKIVVGSFNDAELIGAIDRLATLRYLKEHTTSDSRAMVLDLNIDGLQGFINDHKVYVQESYDSITSTAFVQTEHIQKGYVKYKLNSTEDVQMLAVQKEAELNAQGYKLVDTFKGAASKMGLYQKQYPSIDVWSGGALPMTGRNTNYIDMQNGFGDLLHDSEEIGMSKEEFSQKEINALREDFERVKQDIVAGKLTSQDLLKQKGTYGVQLAVDGSAKNFFLQTSVAQTLQYGSPKTNGCVLLSYMHGNSIRKSKANTLINNLISFLEAYQANHMDPNTHRAIYEFGSLSNNVGMRFVQISSNSKDSRVQQVWNKLPINFKRYCESKELWVPESWVLDIFGTHQFTLADAKLIQGLPLQMKQALAIGENLFRYIAQTVRDKIVFIMPTVLGKNIVANYFLSLITLGPDRAWEILTMQKKALQDTKSYLDATMELDDIYQRARMRGDNSLTHAEKLRVAALKQIKEDSPLKALVDNNMFSSIISDTQLSKRENTMYIKNKINDTAFMQRINQFKKNSKFAKALSFLTLDETTGIYRTMYIATQYSDFVARAAEYYIQMAHPVDSTGKAIQKFKDRSGKQYTPEYIAYEKALVSHLTYKFVNYELPVSDIEQYLNDISFIRFAKWRKRIQWIITHSAINCPINTLLSLVLANAWDIGPMPIEDSGFLDPSSIFTPIANPLDTMIMAITPSALVMYNNLFESNY